MLILLLLMIINTFGQPDRRAFHNSNNVVGITPTAQSIYINFSATDLNIGTKWNDVFGNPAASVLIFESLTDTLGAFTGVSLSTIATANWSGYAGNSASDLYNVSITGTYYPATLAANVWYSNWWQYGSVSPARYDAAKPQLRLSGLTPSSTYDIYITTAELCCGGGFTAKGVFTVVGLTSPTAIEVDGDVASQTLGATFTLQPKVDGTMDIWCNTSTTNTGDLNPFPALIIKRH